jgi:hypothetical protein
MLLIDRYNHQLIIGQYQAKKLEKCNLAVILQQAMCAGEHASKIILKVRNEIKTVNWRALA